MVVSAIAMTEVKDGSLICRSDARLDWDDAVDDADDFMMRCVGDFYGIDPADTTERRKKVESRVSRETSAYKGSTAFYRKLECRFIDEKRGFTVMTSVKETELM